MGSINFVDPYKDVETGIFRNLVNARDKVSLDLAEANLVPLREIELHTLKRFTSDMGSEIQMIHQQLFQDVYDWAGLFRTVDLRKNIDGAEPFLAAHQIPQALAYFELKLQDAREFKGLDRKSFVKQLSRFYEELNYIHPFREGNGRAQRVYWSRIAVLAGWEINWLSISGSENDSACRVAAEQQNFDPLLRMFDKAVHVAGEIAEEEPQLATVLGASPGYVSAETEVYEIQQEE